MRNLLVLGGITLILLAVAVPTLTSPGALTPEQEAARAAAMETRTAREAHVALAEAVVSDVGPSAVPATVRARFTASSVWTTDDLARLDRTHEHYAEMTRTADASIDPRRRHAARSVARELELGLEAVSAHLRTEDAEAARTALSRSVLAAETRTESVHTELLARAR